MKYGFLAPAYRSDWIEHTSKNALVKVFRVILLYRKKYASNTNDITVDCKWYNSGPQIISYIMLQTAFIIFIPTIVLEHWKGHFMHQTQHLFKVAYCLSIFECICVFVFVWLLVYENWNAYIKNQRQDFHMNLKVHLLTKWDSLEIILFNFLNKATWATR